MDGSEITESAKAVQEVAKATKTGIEATEKLGSFVSRIIGEPLDEVSGILKDKLKFVRWERQQRLTTQAHNIIGQKNIQGELRIVPPKIALPIIENASLEENDELQDLWIYFLSSAVDPNFNGTLRAAFIDIIKQLEVNDVHILNFVHTQYENYKLRRKLGNVFSIPEEKLTEIESSKVSVEMKTIVAKLGIKVESYKESIDNLIRVRCISSFIDNKTIDLPRQDPFADSLTNFPQFRKTFNPNKVSFNITHIYDKVCITPLGLSFAKACMAPKTENKLDVESEKDNAETNS